MGTKVEQLKAILDSQEYDPSNWDTLAPDMRETEGGWELGYPQVQIAFMFDKTGEKFLGLVNWKE